MTNFFLLSVFLLNCLSLCILIAMHPTASETKLTKSSLWQFLALALDEIKKNNIIKIKKIFFFIDD